jgi:hypothetical protein
MNLVKQAKIPLGIAAAFSYCFWLPPHARSDSALPPVMTHESPSGISPLIGAHLECAALAALSNRPFWSN